MSVKGIVYDIQRFSLHDGPGIRTTVFLKGCPLRCLWCHNPEAQSFEKQLSYNENKCVNCLSCVGSCPNGTHFSVESRHKVNFELCRACGSCAAACSYGALRIIGGKMSVEEVLEEVKKDSAYYMNSGGGMTISGGEPAGQYEFTLDLLESAKSLGIHTCIETCGFVKQERLERLSRFVDLFLFDCKETNPEKHKLFTGASNDIILSNLDFLYKSGASIVLRCPVIPGMNDTMEHFEGITQLSRKYPGLTGIEIMAYHDMGRSKAAQVGMEYPVEAKSAGDEDKKLWISTLKGLGCQHITA